MTARCLSCLGPVEAPGVRHPKCTRELFGSTREPAIDLELAKLHTYGLAMVGHTSLSGAQRKLSLSLSSDRATLRLAVADGQYILKPQTGVFPELPEHEHVTMRLAAQAGLDVPACGLVHLRDGSCAYLVKRFDRDAGRKVAMEDFCQLAEKAPKQKYDGSAELLFRLLKRYASEPGVDALRLFRQLLFAWWTGNGDLHLKNVALIEDDGRHRVSPVFDLLCTGLVIPDDPLALPMGGKRSRLTRRDWEALGTHAGLPPRVTQRVLAELIDGLGRARQTVDASFLGPEMRTAYIALLETRAAVLDAGA